MIYKNIEIHNAADMVRPNIYGVQRIADIITERIKEVVTK